MKYRAVAARPMTADEIAANACVVVAVALFFAAIFTGSVACAIVGAALLWEAEKTRDEVQRVLGPRFRWTRDE